MPHWKLMTDRDFLGACDLQGKEVVCTISRVEQGALNRAGSKKTDRKPVISFEGKAKRLVGNATNCTTLERMYGSDTTGWVGKRVTLYPTTTKLKGVDVECIRIRPTPPRSATRDTPTAETPRTEIVAEMTAESPTGSSDPTPEEIEEIRAQELREAAEQERERRGG